MFMSWSVHKKDPINVLPSEIFTFMVLFNQLWRRSLEFNGGSSSDIYNMVISTCKRLWDLRTKPHVLLTRFINVPKQCPNLLYIWFFSTLREL